MVDVRNMVLFNQLSPIVECKFINSLKNLFSPMDNLNFDLFEKARKKLQDIDDKLATSLLHAVEEAYKKAGIKGVDDLFVEIRNKYVGDEYET